MYFAPTFPLFIDRDPTWKLTKSWELTRTLTNISRISKNLTHSLRIARAYSDIDFAHSRTSQTLLIAPRLVRHWLKLLQIACAYSGIDFAHSRMSQSLLNSSQKWHNQVTIPFCDLTGTAAASEYKYRPVLTLTPQLIEFVLYPLLLSTNLKASIQVAIQAFYTILTSIQ
jgi:hypothetical protein